MVAVSFFDRDSPSPVPVFNGDYLNTALIRSGSNNLAPEDVLATLNFLTA